MEKVVHKYKLGEEPPERRYWLTKSPEERLNALHQLISRHHGNTDQFTGRLQRVFRIVHRAQS
jgi:hypothetical protein